MRLGREVELRRRAPAAHFDVVVFALADRNAVVGQVGNAEQDVAQTRVGFFGALLRFGDLLAQLLCLVDLRCGVLLVLLELAISSVALLRWAFRVSDSVMAARRS